jgi:non-ribosomal peptide synthetase component E (peptide arylation enzyme)
VVSAPDSRHGEMIVAVVVPREGAELDLEGLRTHFAESRLARQKAPERLIILEALPRTALGKVRKDQLHRDAATDLGRAVISPETVVLAGRGIPLRPRGNRRFE